MKSFFLAKKSDDQLKQILEEHESSDSYNWISDFVYGGIDGAVTTFAVVAGVEGASLSLPVILILGFANLFADGFSMAVGKYSSDKASIESYNRIKAIEYNHLTERRDHEIGEITEILHGYGFKGQDLDRAVEVIVANPDAWVDLMMRNEFNLTQENVNPIRGAVITFTSFLAIGFIPLIAYTFNFLFKLSPQNVFWVTVMATLGALFTVGAVKSKFSVKKWFWSGLETALIGGVAAAIAYGVGYLLRGVTG